jgi:hypothetical protein
MNRSTLFFIIVTTLLVGSLIGVNIQPQQTAIVADSSVTTTTGLNYRLIDPNDFTIQYNEFGRADPVTTGENFVSSNKSFKHEILEIPLELDSSVEYKAEMEQGDSIVYRWSVDNGDTYFDFHGHPNTLETEFFTRYREGEGSTGSGSIVAAYKGQHGWFWLNISDHPITIKLEVAGFYDKIVLLPTY